MVAIRNKKTSMSGQGRFFTMRERTGLIPFLLVMLSSRFLGPFGGWRCTRNYASSNRA
jgi:hypothetical protein